MSALFNACPRGEYGQILAIQGDGPPDSYVNGLPFEAGRLAIDIGPTNPRWHQGLPLTPAGRVACGNLAPSRFNSGTMPLTPAGRLAVDIVEATAVNLYANPELAGGGLNTPPTDHGVVFGTNEYDFEEYLPGIFQMQANFNETNGRCPLAYDLGANNPDLVIGDRYRISWDIENNSNNFYARGITVTGESNVEVIELNQGVAATGVTTVSAVFRPSAGYAAVIRIGNGTTANSSFWFTIRNPKLVNLDVSPFPEAVAHGVNYAADGSVQMEIANLAPPIFRDTFNGAAGTDLVNHTPDVGGPWEALGGVLRISDAQSAQANGTGSGANNPTFWSRTFNTAVVEGKKRITWRSSNGAGGTSLVQGVFVLGDASGANKVTLGLINNEMRIQLWESGQIAGTETLTTLPENAGSTGEFEFPFYIILDGTTVTYGYGNQTSPEVEVTREYPQFAGNYVMGVIMRTSTNNGIYEITYQDW